MDINITSNLTKDGTTVTIDGKTFKNVHAIDFDMYHDYDYPRTEGDQSEGHHCFSMCITTKEESEDGTMKCLTYRYNREDEGEVYDSVKDTTPKVDQLAKFIADSMSGRKSRIL